MSLPSSQEPHEISESNYNAAQALPKETRCTPHQTQSRRQSGRLTDEEVVVLRKVGIVKPHAPGDESGCITLSANYIYPSPVAPGFPPKSRQRDNTEYTTESAAIADSHFSDEDSIDPRVHRHAGSGRTWDIDAPVLDEESAALLDSPMSSSTVRPYDRNLEGEPLELSDSLMSSGTMRPDNNDAEEDFEVVMPLEEEEDAEDTDQTDQDRSIEVVGERFWSRWCRALAGYLPALLSDSKN